MNKNEINKKSNNESSNTILKLGQSIVKFEDYQRDFIDNYKNKDVNELKSMANLTTEESRLFDYMYNKKEFVDDNFFKEMKFIRNNNNNNVISYMIDYLKVTYKIITPKILKSFFEESIILNK